MAKCKRCDKNIEFRPHPISGKLTPFDVGGDIHFASCKNLKDERHTSINDPRNLKCSECGADSSGVYWKEISNGQKRLKIKFKCGHPNFMFLAHTEFNKSLVDNFNKPSQSPGLK